MIWRIILNLEFDSDDVYNNVHYLVLFGDYWFPGEAFNCLWYNPCDKLSLKICKWKAL